MNTQKLAPRLQVMNFLRSLAQYQQCGPREKQGNCAGTSSSNPCPRGWQASLQGPRRLCTPQALQAPGPCIWPLIAAAQGRPAVSSPCNSVRSLLRSLQRSEGVQRSNGRTRLHQESHNHRLHQKQNPSTGMSQI